MKIKERGVLPNDIDLYGPLDNCIRSTISAEQFIKKSHKLKIDDHTTDGEHYIYNIHKIIAEEYIPYLKMLDKT